MAKVLKIRRWKLNLCPLLPPASIVVRCRQTVAQILQVATFYRCELHLPAECRTNSVLYLWLSISMLPSKHPPFSAIHLHQRTQTKSMIMTTWNLFLTTSLRLGHYLPSGIAFSLFSPRPPQWSPSWPCGRRRGTPAGGWACAIQADVRAL